MTKKLSDLFKHPNRIKGQSVTGALVIEKLLQQSDKGELGQLRRKFTAAYEECQNKASSRAKLLENAAPALDALIENKDPQGEEAEAVFKGLIAVIHPDMGDKFKYADFITYAYEQLLVSNQPPIKTEDLYKITEDLRAFDTLRKKPEDYPLMFEQLARDTAHIHEKKAEKAKRKLSPEDRASINVATTVLYDGEEGKVIIPHTKKASQYWGDNTRWCIAAKGEDNAFDGYNTKKPILIFIPTPTVDEKAEFEQYSSFKFALVEGKWYDELDEASSATPSKTENQFPAPPSLERLQKKCFQEQPEFQKFILSKSDSMPLSNRRHSLNYDKIMDKIHEIELIVRNPIVNSSIENYGLANQIIIQGLIDLWYPTETDNSYNRHVFKRIKEEMPQEASRLIGLESSFVSSARDKILNRNYFSLYDDVRSLTTQKYPRETEAIENYIREKIQSKDFLASYFESEMGTTLNRRPEAINLVVENLPVDLWKQYVIDHPTLIKHIHATRYGEEFVDHNEERAHKAINLLWDAMIKKLGTDDPFALADCFPPEVVQVKLRELMGQAPAGSLESLELQQKILQQCEDVPLHHMPALFGNPKALVDREEAMRVMQEKLGVAKRINQSAQTSELPGF